VYSPAECEYCLDCKQVAARLSGRFAAKEAVLKALGTGLRAGINWTEVETLPDALGRPIVTLHGEAARRAAQLGITTVLVSISHTGDYAVASALGGYDKAEG
jgi:holo-[acyl-carrier protein] synthase